MPAKIISLFLVMLLVFSMAAAAAEGAAITVTDMDGRVITFDEPVTRIVALTPSDCEILCAIGCGDMLVGRGEFCDWPESILDLPSLATGENTNVEEVLALEPQAVLVSDAHGDDTQIRMLEANGVKVVISDSTDIAGVYTSIRLIGAITGRDAEAEEVIADMQATFDAISDRAEASGRTIYFEVMPLEWGLWCAGSSTFMHEIAHICGMENAFADIDGWQPVSEEQVMERNPDYIVLVTGMGDTAVDEVMGRAGWGDITAVMNGAVYNADSYEMTRPGPRLKDAAIDLYNFLYGDDFTGTDAE